MVILLIGGRNKIASQLVVDLNNQHSFKFLTNNSSGVWRFGEECNLSDFDKIDRIIFLAWNKRDLNSSLNSLNYILNIKNSSFHDIDLLFISSYSIFNKTRYGISKLIGEELVKSHGGKFIRSPLIKDNLDTYELKGLLKFVKLFPIIPSNQLWGGAIENVSLENLVQEIGNWISDPKTFTAPGLLKNTIESTSISEILRNNSISNLKTYFIIDFGAKVFKLFFSFFGSKSRTVDSILGFYLNDLNPIKVRYREEQV